MKQKIYIETSVISYLVARTSKNIIIAAHQALTTDFWQQIDDYETYISDIVIQEISKGDQTQAKLRCQLVDKFPILQIDHEAKELARKLLTIGIIPNKCPEDALHIAVAASNGMDAILTWNFKHINNFFTKRKIRQVIEDNGWTCPEICSPEEFLGNKI